jgi:hypothetical protein
MITDSGDSYRLRDPEGEWLLTTGSMLELWTEEVVVQVSVSNA